MKGFTLIESLVIIVIFVLVVGVVFAGYVLSQRGYREGEISAELTQNARVVLERMTREIRQAREILTELPLTFDQASSSGEIEFEDGHIEESYYYIRYFKDNGEIKREVKRYYLAGVAVAWDAAPQEELEVVVEDSGSLGEFIEELRFWSSEEGTVNIFITLEKAGKQAVFSTSVFGRNL